MNNYIIMTLDKLEGTEKLNFNVKLIINTVATIVSIINITPITVPKVPYLLSILSNLSKVIIM